VTGERLTLRIDLDAGERAGDDERDEATRALRGELLELDVDAVERPQTVTPEGARAGEALTLGTLVVTLGPHALAAVSGVVRGWLDRRGDRSVALELDGDRIELTNTSAEEQRRLVDAFVARHMRG
jgi:hypothetical protein